jgi:serine O-acetyltransferase
MTFTDIVCRDLYRYYGRIDFLTFLRAYFRVKAFRFTFWLRAAAHFHSRHGVPARIAYVVCRLLLDHYSLIYGYQIHDKTQIGPGLYLAHFGSVVINPAATIGRNVNVAVGVTIGQTNRGLRAGVPTLGDRVWVGTNAIVVGRITIGDGALIGPGAYVNFDVPSNAVVIGNPGRIVSEAGTAGYIDNILDD